MNNLLIKKIKPVLGLVCVNISFLVAGSVQAETRQEKTHQLVEQALSLTPNLEKGKSMYRSCAACHTPEGWGNPSGRYPQIAGQHQSVLLKQLADIRLENRDNPTMIPFTNTLFNKGAQALADITAYISRLPMVPNNSIGYGARLSEGKQFYVDNCEKCHGKQGEGDAKKFYPRIHGQHFNYIVRQMHWIKDGKRRNADSKMMKQIESFTYDQLAVIADYVSRLRPDKNLLADRMDWRNPDFRSGFMSAPHTIDSLR